MSSVKKCNIFDIRENENNTMKNNVFYTDIVMDKVEKKKINDLNLNFNRVEVGKLVSKKNENPEKIIKEENKKMKSPIPNFNRGSLKNIINLTKKKKVKKKVNFPEKCMIFIIEVESFKKYNLLNTNRNLIKKPTSCKCNIY